MDRVRSGALPWTNLDTLQRESIEKLVARHGITGLTAADLDHMTGAWHRLDPWPDSVAGLARLRTRYIIGPLSNGNVALLVNMAKRAGLPWDMVFATELFRHYKPDPETYLGACDLLGLAPSQVMMAAAHNYDLHAARRLGLRTCFFARPTEYGPHQTKDFAADSDWDIVGADIEDVAARLGC
jgi:2-haloacid dehalogenase